jgi:hypothetical protein
MFNYIGPTWADRSFDNDTAPTTNFALEWDIPYTPQVFLSAPPLTIARSVNLDNRLPIVWVYSDPWGNIESITGMTRAEYVQRGDWFSIWQECNRYIFQTISKLGPPVFLIGTHCDIVDCDYSNITIAHPSMQKWMAQAAGIDVVDGVIHLPQDNVQIKHCVAMELYFKFFYDHPEIVVDSVLHEHIINQWVLWDKLSTAGLMFDYHPTRRSYIGFAKSLYLKLTNFLSDKNNATTP